MSPDYVCLSSIAHVLIFAIMSFTALMVGGWWVQNLRCTIVARASLLPVGGMCRG